MYLSQDTETIYLDSRLQNSSTKILLLSEGNSLLFVKVTLIRLLRSIIILDTLRIPRTSLKSVIKYATK